LTGESLLDRWVLFGLESAGASAETIKSC